MLLKATVTNVSGTEIANISKGLNMKITVDDKNYDVPDIGTPVYFVKEYGDTYRLLKSSIHHIEIGKYSFRIMYEKTLGKGDFGIVCFGRGTVGDGHLDFNKAKSYWEQLTGKVFKGGPEEVAHC